MASPLKADVKKLQQHWYDRLKEDGFEDIEDTRHPKSPLKAWHSYKWKHVSPDLIMAKQVYYDKAAELLNTYEFENHTHRIIWELHIDGLSTREIAAKILGFETTYKRAQVGNIVALIASAIL